MPGADDASRDAVGQILGEDVITMAVGSKAVQKRPLLERTKRYLRDARAELRKVSWPNRKELTTYTIVVVVITIIVSIFIGLVDFIFSEIFGLLGIVRG